MVSSEIIQQCLDMVEQHKRAHEQFVSDVFDKHTDRITKKRRAFLRARLELLVAMNDPRQYAAMDRLVAFEQRVLDRVSSAKQELANRYYGPKLTAQEARRRRTLKRRIQHCKNGDELDDLFIQQIAFEGDIVAKYGVPDDTCIQVHSDETPRRVVRDPVRSKVTRSRSKARGRGLSL